MYESVTKTTTMSISYYFLISIISIISFLLIWWYLSVRKLEKLNQIPGPKPIPIIGNVFEIGNTPEKLLNNLTKLSKKYGDLYKFFIGPYLRVVISNPEHLENILSSNQHITKSESYEALKQWLGDGLLLTSGNKWKIRRKMITPTFHFKILLQFLDVFNEASDILITQLLKETHNDIIDIHQFMKLCTLDIICETSLGVQVKAQETKNVKYLLAVRKILELTISRVFSVWEKYDFLYKFSSKYKIYQKSLNNLHNFTNNVIKERRETIKTSQLKSEDEEGIKHKMALLDMLLLSEFSHNLTNEDIREEVDTFMFAGHDTVTSGISFTLLELAKNPKVQQKLYEEIVQFTNRNSQFTMQQLQEMKYLELVIKEGLRYYPSIPFIERRIQNKCVIDGYDLSKDKMVVLFIYGLHHSEKYYPDPEKFDPNRFLPENQAKRHPFAYLPFSAGPRNCIGQKFAMLEMKCIIAKIIRNFRVLSIENFQPKLGFAGVLSSKNGIRIQLRAR